MPTKKFSLLLILSTSFYHYLLKYQEGAERGGGGQVGACAGEEFQSILGLLPQQTVGKKKLKAFC